MAHAAVERARSNVVGEWAAGRLALLVGIAGALALALLDALVTDAPTPRGDEEIYERMADDPFAAHTFPFAYRIAIPWLVHVLPVDHDVSFSVLAWACSGAAGACLFLALERLGFARRLSLPLAFILVLSPILLVASLRQGRSPDPLSILVMCAGVLFIVERRGWPLAATMLVGVANRESALFLAPLAYALWTERWIDARLLGRVALLTAPAVAALVALRFSIPTVGQGVGGYSSLFGARLEVLEIGAEGWPTLLRRLGTAFGPGWLLAAYAVVYWRWAQKGLGVLTVLCVAAASFALDWHRVAFVAAPVVFAASAWTLTRHPKLRWPAWALWAALIAGYAIYMDVSGVQSGIIDNPLPQYPIR